MILVTGATGTVGREIVAQLLSGGHRLRALTRNPGAAGLDLRVEVIGGDLGRPETLARAVDGVESVFSLALAPKIAEHERNLAAASKRAGVRHFVKLSVLGAGGSARGGVASWHGDGEQAVRESGVPWTFVRPGVFMSNALWWRDDIRTRGKVFSNFGEGRVPYVHPRDIAAVAVRALTSPGHEGEAYDLTGPEALSVREQLRILGAALGRRLEFVSIDDDAIRAQMEAARMPPYLIDALLPFGSVVRSGAASKVLPTVEQVLGRPALTFDAWAREFAPLFR